MDINTKQNFHCLYCGIDHPMNLHTKEHIIPESLLNKNYTLSNTCRKFNRYMASSFENKVLNLYVIKEIITTINPPLKPIYRGSLPNDFSSFDLHRYVSIKGEELRLHPQYQNSNVITIKVNGPNDEVYLYDLKLPFDILISINAHPSLISEDKAEYSRNQIEDYLKALNSDPGINIEFNDFLKKVNGTYTFKKVKKAINYTESEINFEEPPETLVFTESENLFKLFIKIAWCHAANQLGDKWLKSPFATVMLNYLLSGHVLNKDIIKHFPELFTKSYNIENEDYIFWSKSIDETFDLINQMENIEQKNLLLEYHHKRQEEHNFISQLISFTPIGVINNEWRSFLTVNRFHSISLYTMNVPLPFGERLETVCHINLFGGYIDVIVRMSSKPLMDIYPSDIRINF